MHARTQLSKAENVVNENLLFSDAHNCYWNFALQHLQNQLRDFGIFVIAVQEKWNAITSTAITCNTVLYSRYHFFTKRAEPSATVFSDL